MENDNPPAPVPAPAADNFEGTKMIILFHILTILKAEYIEIEMECV